MLQELNGIIADFARRYAAAPLWSPRVMKPEKPQLE
jgi:hypothetical protein